MKPTSSLPVGILGATGKVGLQFIRLLDKHPWFQVAFLAASQKSAGLPFFEALKQRGKSYQDIPPSVLQLPVHSVEDLSFAKTTCSFVFSALSSSVAKTTEEEFARSNIPVISNASAHRLDPDVPILIPEVNPEHLNIIAMQQKKRGWDKGFILTKPNCSIQSYTAPLFALDSLFEVQRILVTTMQALSGSSDPNLNLKDNILPWIAKEEEKSEREPLKILGRIHEGELVPNTRLKISAQCNRVPVLDGHLASVSFDLKHKASQEQILECWKTFQGLPQKLALPSAPKQPLLYHDLPDRPQPLLDCNQEGGMSISLGRLKTCPVLNYRFVGLSHNTIRGAAGGAILSAELLTHQGYLS